QNRMEQINRVTLTSLDITSRGEQQNRLGRGRSRAGNPGAADRPATVGGYLVQPTAQLADGKASFGIGGGGRHDLSVLGYFDRSGDRQPRSGIEYLAAQRSRPGQFSVRDLNRLRRDLPGRGGRGVNVLHGHDPRQTRNG